MASLVDPTPASTRSAVVDWLELKCLTSPRNRAGASEIVGLRELFTGTEDENATEGEDGAILESEQELQLQSLASEIAYRQAVLNTNYPFIVGEDGASLTFNPDLEPSKAQWIYLFCLIASAIRNKQLKVEAPVVQQIANLFQACACAAAGGYLTGEVCSFGFPRAEGNGFLPALKIAIGRLGEGIVNDNPQVPPGLAADLKDGGIDLIAWKNFPDKMPGKMYLLGQSASGNNWRDKTVKGYVDSFHADWLSTMPGSTAIAAMFIPFSFHQLFEEDKRIGFDDLMRRHFLTDTRAFGIVHDRFRVAHFAGVGFDTPEPATNGIDGADKFADIRQWVIDVRGTLAGAAAAA